MDYSIFLKDSEEEIKKNIDIVLKHKMLEKVYDLKRDECLEYFSDKNKSFIKEVGRKNLNYFFFFLKNYMTVPDIDPEFIGIDFAFSEADANYNKMIRKISYLKEYFFHFFQRMISLYMAFESSGKLIICDGTALTEKSKFVTSSDAFRLTTPTYLGVFKKDGEKYFLTRNIVFIIKKEKNIFNEDKGHMFRLRIWIESGFGISSYFNIFNNNFSKEYLKNLRLFFRECGSTFYREQLYDAV